MTGREQALTAGAIAAAILWAVTRSSKGQAVTVDALEELIRGGQRVIDRVRALITGEEGLRLEVYLDEGREWTIGWGHLVKPGERFHPYGPVTKITRQEADELLEADTADATRAVQELVGVPLTDAQRAALISLVFNIGRENFRTSTLLAKLNAGDYGGAAAEFDRWVFVKGNRSNGLIARRQREREVFLS